MPILTVPLDESVVDSSSDIELFFQPARNRVFSARLAAAPSDAAGAAAVVAQVRHPSVRLIGVGRFRALDTQRRPLDAIVQYEGEPPRLLGQIGLRTDEPGVDADLLIREWIACRLRQGVAPNPLSPYRLFFLGLDLLTAPTLMLDWTEEQWRAAFDGPWRDVAERLVPRWTPAERADRINRINDAGFVLDNRIQNIPRLGAALRRFERSELDTYTELTGLFQRLLQDLLQGDPGQFAEAFDLFSAGILRQECPVSDPRLRGASAVACDADSAAVFCFAELAFLVFDSVRSSEDLRNLRAAQDMEAFWRTHLNVLVRIQEGYLARWGIDRYRMRFKDFGLAPERLTVEEYKRATHSIRRLGDDEGALRADVLARVRALLSS